MPSEYITRLRQSEMDDEGNFSSASLSPGVRWFLLTCAVSGRQASSNLLLQRPRGKGLTGTYGRGENRETWVVQRGYQPTKRKW